MITYVVDDRSKRETAHSTKTPKHQNTKTPKHQNIEQRDWSIEHQDEEKRAPKKRAPKIWDRGKPKQRTKTLEDRSTKSIEQRHQA